MENLIRISAKNLGALALPTACLRCIWLKLHMNHRLPFQIFPGIFSSIDSYTKRIIHAYFDHHSEPPSWLADLGPLIGYRDPPHFSKFNYIEPQYNIMLTGMPDGIFIRENQSHIIVDYKTAKFTATQDELFPMYETQLNVYASIGEQCGFEPVTDLALIYMEPMTTGQGRLDRQCREYGFDMGFSAHILKVDLKPDSLKPLLTKTRKLFESSEPPIGRPGCKNCELTERLIELARGKSIISIASAIRK